jgi:hypothetical protein
MAESGRYACFKAIAARGYMLAAKPHPHPLVEPQFGHE